MNDTNTSKASNRPRQRQESVLRTRLDRRTADHFNRLAEEAGLNRSELLRRVIVEAVRRERLAA